MHGAAHIFFENKLAETEATFNAKLSKLERRVKKEIRDVSKLQTEELRNIRNELKALEHEVVDIKQSEEDLSHIGMNKIRRLSKNVKDEVHDIRKIKSEVKLIKTEITDIKKVEDDISHIGMDQISRLNKEFKAEVVDLKSQLDRVKEKVTTIKNEKEDVDIHKDVMSRLHLMNLSKDELQDLVERALVTYFNTEDFRGENKKQEVSKSSSSGSHLGSPFSSLESHMESDGGVTEDLGKPCTNGVGIHHLESVDEKNGKENDDEFEENKGFVTDHSGGQEEVNDYPENVPDTLQTVEKVT